jgi:hypothetical protein
MTAENIVKLLLVAALCFTPYVIFGLVTGVWW